MPAAASPSSEFARWWGDGLQSNFRAYCNCAVRRHRRYIAADEPAAAKTFAMRLLERADLLSEFPELGTSYRKRKNVRRLRCDPYFIYYRVRREGSVIEVMDFWHSARVEPNL